MRTPGLLLRRTISRNLDSLSKRGLGILQIILANVGFREIEERVEILRLQRGRLRQFALSARKTILLERDVSEHVVATNVIGIDLDLRLKFRDGLAIPCTLIVPQVSQCQIIMCVDRVTISRDRFLEFRDRLIGVVHQAVGAAEVDVNKRRVSQASGHFVKQPSRERFLVQMR